MLPKHQPDSWLLTLASSPLPLIHLSHHWILAAWNNSLLNPYSDFPLSSLIGPHTYFRSYFSHLHATQSKKLCHPRRHFTCFSWIPIIPLQLVLTIVVPEPVISSCFHQGCGLSPLRNEPRWSFIVESLYRAFCSHPYYSENGCSLVSWILASTDPTSHPAVVDWTQVCDN